MAGRRGRNLRRRGIILSGRVQHDVAAWFPVTANAAEPLPLHTPTRQLGNLRRLVGKLWRLIVVNSEIRAFGHGPAVHTLVEMAHDRLRRLFFVATVLEALLAFAFVDLAQEIAGVIQTRRQLHGKTDLGLQLRKRAAVRCAVELFNDAVQLAVGPFFAIFRWQRFFRGVHLSEKCSASGKCFCWNSRSAWASRSGTDFGWKPAG